MPGPPDHNEHLDKEEKKMTDPNTTDSSEARTWERMDIPERDGDPFTYFTGDGPGDDLDI
ncbi:hypothetical protein A5722_15020 [Mycobacterium vulneris]|nr:hypothetical protein A5722_15020 [Mycolicibacterium vulneris]OCB66232.1 hypothetical protein A5729_12525 [Mycolicibacterium vulneris]